MNEREQHLNKLRLAEQQFRLACTVNLAVTNEVQTLDVPVVWAFGRHSVSYEDFALRSDQADQAAAQLETTATFVIAAAIRDAMIALFPNPKGSDNPDIVAAYQISRLLRNAFSHSMLRPKWSIDADCQDRIFAIDEVISLNPAGLDGKPLDWRDYGGPLAMFYFGRFVREILLNDKIDPNRLKPTFPKVVCYQQGRLTLRRVAELPAGAVKVAEAGPGESIDLGHGHRLQVLRPNA
ncbi:MAG: hypothetical protein P4M09_06030 [Devosia sp.]|nr:hypothetical protein [Devosia sp.]